MPKLHRHRAPQTLQSTKRAIKRFTAVFGYMPLENLTPLFLQEYVNSLSKTPTAAGNKILSYGSIKRYTAVLSAMLSQAVRWNLINNNPMERVQLKKDCKAAAHSKVTYFTPEQAEIFLHILDEPLSYKYSSRQRKDKAGKKYQVREYQSAHSIQLQLKLFFYLAMFTGCRRGELIALTWDDIDFEESSIQITKSSCRVSGETIIKSTKNADSVRKISVPSVILQIAHEWKAKQAYHRFSMGSQWQGSNYVFIQWNGQQMGLETPYQDFRRIIDNYNAHRKEGAPELPLIPLHGLRHPYVKPTTKKFLSFFKFEMAISLRAFLCFALLLGIKEGPQFVPFIR